MEGMPVVEPQEPGPQEPGLQQPGPQKKKRAAVRQKGAGGAKRRTPARRRPLKRTAIEKLQLRLVDYKARHQTLTQKNSELGSKIDDIEYEMQCRAAEAAADGDTATGQGSSSDTGGEQT